ncbi:MAG: glycosyltransferase family 2 protein [Bacilli bacterium]
MENNLISVIVPIYNVDNFLRQCLNSIVNQTYKNLEIILVDDGSTDTSLKICLEYQLRDKRILVFSKRNGGQSAARNIGLDIAKGDYIIFVDSDDWCELDCIQYLFDKCVNDELNYASVTGYDFYEESGRKVLINKSKDVIFSNREAVEDILQFRRFTSDAPQFKLYKKELFKGLRFIEGMIFEDTQIMVHILDRVNKGGFYNIPKFTYRIHPNSTTKSLYSSKNKAQVLAYELNKNFIINNYPYLLKNLEHNVVASALFNLLRIYLNDIEKYFSDDIKYYNTFLEKYRPIISKDYVLVDLLYYAYKLSKKLTILIMKIFKKQLKNRMLI